ncbi:MAG: SDR family NAD(P)-dependent oxidoreductase [Gammaproteobacteria bacterium]
MKTLPNQDAQAGGTSMDIYGKIAVITGAASGIGEAVARELGGLGVKVMALVDRSPAVHEAARAVTRIAGSGLKCEPFVGDVTEEGFYREGYDQMNGQRTNHASDRYQRG